MRHRTLITKTIPTIILASLYLFSNPFQHHCIHGSKEGSSISRSSPPNSSSPIPTTTTPTTKPMKPATDTILLIDVDHTLYRESQLPNHHGIESQIIQRTHDFGFRYYGLTPTECDALYHRYGSTVEGLRRMVSNGLSMTKEEGKVEADRMLERFYREVYEGIDLSPLVAFGSVSSSSTADGEEEEGTVETGYNGATVTDHHRRRQFLTDLMHSLTSNTNPNVHIYLASNSPRFHVLRVLTALGLRNVPYAGILTPDSVTIPSKSRLSSLSYPTKSDPEVFYSHVLETHGVLDHNDGRTAVNHMVLIDDSKFNLERAGEVGIKGIRIGNRKPEENHGSDGAGGAGVETLEEAIGIALGRIPDGGRLWIPPSRSSSSLNQNDTDAMDRTKNKGGGEREEGYVFSDVKYLQSKNKIDLESINPEVWQRMIRELTLRLHDDTKKETDRDETLRIVDVGAGLLSTFDLVLHGGGGKESLVSALLTSGNDDGDGSTNASFRRKPERTGTATTTTTTTSLKRIHYVAYEPNRNLLSSCRAYLSSVGFIERQHSSKMEPENTKDEDKKDDIKKQGVGGNENDELIFHRSANYKGGGGIEVTLFLRLRDFRDERNTNPSSSPSPPPHLLVGCCFADLFDPPEALIASLLRLIGYFSPSSSSSHHQYDQTATEGRRGTLLYFPITFAGTTQFVPPRPFGVVQSSPSSAYRSLTSASLTGGSGGAVVPSDTLAFRLYARSLTRRHGHNLDPNRIVEAVNGVGGMLLADGPSDWTIPSSSSKDHQHETKKEENNDVDEDGVRYLWETMLYFFGTGAVPEMGIARGSSDSGGGGKKWDGMGWLNRAREKRPDIVVTNVDLLLSLPSLGGVEGGKGEEDELEGSEEEVEINAAGAVDGKRETLYKGGDKKMKTRKKKTKLTVETINFTAPRTVGTVTEEWDTTDGKHLGPGQIEVETVCSLISSGTELKIFKGTFSPTSPLDVNIPGFSTQSMSYPLSYGYSSVGRVTRCAPDVPDAETLLNSLVFSFSPHASHLILDRDAVQVVPEGVDAEDAAFLPSVETALSIVHDAHVRMGEEVVVMGQGLVGLLVTRLLTGGDRSNNDSGDSATGMKITVVDTLPSRLAASSRMGAPQALLPPTISSLPPFDVAIEVSGNPRALQSAIDCTRSGGRIVVASWYGDGEDVRLRLGIDFHRSHKTIVTSQVSEIPAALRGTWSKERRFGLAWDLVREIRPGRELVTRRLELGEAQVAYERLDGGKEIAVLFKYGS